MLYCKNHSSGRNDSSMENNPVKKDLLKNLQEKVYSFCTQEKKVFFLAMGIAFFCSLCYCCFFTDIHRDTAGVYALYAAEIGKGNFQEGLVSNVPMLIILLGGSLAWCGVEVMTALTLVSCFFYVATLFPLRRFLERYVSPPAASWGCVLYACAPKLILFSCVPLLESARIFFMISALLFFFRCADKPEWKSAVLCGLSCGALTAARGEGIMISAALLAGYLLYIPLFCRRKITGKHIGSFLLIVLCCFASLLPFCFLNYIKSGYFVPDTRAVEFTEKLITFVHNSRQTGAAEASQVFMSVEEGNTSWKAKIWNVLSGMFRGGYEGYVPFALLGIFLILRRRQWKPDYFVLVGMTLMLSVIYTVVVSSYRYHLYMIPLFMMFTLTGLAATGKKLSGLLPLKGKILLGLFCIVFLAGQIHNGIARAFSKRGETYRKAGLWIAEYGRKYCPSRPLKVYAHWIPEVIYWSKAQQVNAYGKPFIAPETVQDFDLIVCRKGFTDVFMKRKDLERIKGVPGDGEKLMIFRKKTFSGGKP